MTNKPTTQPSQFKEIPTKIFEWLLNRGISENIIREANLSWNGTHLVIPIYGQDGEFKFNKYRRSPFVTDGPKYRYDSGSTAMLYGAERILESSNVFPLLILEGEMDALRARACGLTAVSSTGGAGTFLDEWIPILNRENVYICYDNDLAGQKGALRVQSLLPLARVITIPQEDGVKDFTDYLSRHSYAEFSTHILGAKKYTIPADVEGITKKALTEKLKELSRVGQDLIENRRALIREKRQTQFIDLILAHISDRVERYQKDLKSFDRPKTDGTDLQNAKRFPMFSLVKFNNQGFASCPFHKDDTPSFYYNNERHPKFPNTGKCYGCGKFADVIDVKMELEGVDFKTAVKLLNGN